MGVGEIGVEPGEFLYLSFRLLQPIEHAAGDDAVVARECVAWAHPHGRTEVIESAAEMAGEVHPDAQVDDHVDHVRVDLVGSLQLVHRPLDHLLTQQERAAVVAHLEVPRPPPHGLPHRLQRPLSPSEMVPGYSALDERPGVIRIHPRDGREVLCRRVISPLENGADAAVVARGLVHWVGAQRPGEMPFGHLQRAPRLEYHPEIAQGVGVRSGPPQHLLQP